MILIAFTYILIFIKKIMKKIIILLRKWVIILKFGNKLVYVENKVIKNFLYYMKDEKIFVISNNLENHSYIYDIQ